MNGPPPPRGNDSSYDGVSGSGGSGDGGYLYRHQQHQRSPQTPTLVRQRDCDDVEPNRLEKRARCYDKQLPTVVYKAGECRQALLKLWKEYEESPSQRTPTLQIRIPAEYVTARNPQVRGGQLWGTDMYTDDSDLVAVLMHTGYCRATASPPPQALQELCVIVMVLPPQDCYTSTLRNSVRSRAWGASSGCSYRVECCSIFLKDGEAVDLEPCLGHTSNVEPTLTPVALERTITTRAAASNALRQQRYVREVTVEYNLCNEPWKRYRLSVVADKGTKKLLYTSARLLKGEVLYLETHSCRYELCFTGEKMAKAQDKDKTGELMNGETVLIDAFRWSRCKRPLPRDLMLYFGIPLSSEHLEVMNENLDWEEIKWSETGVFVAGKEYALQRLHFMSPEMKSDKPETSLPNGFLYHQKIVSC